MNAETYQRLGYARHEIWELYGVLQAVAVTLLLYLEIPNDKIGIKNPLTACFFLFGLAASAAFCLGKHWMTVYQLLLIALALGFLVEDYLLQKLSERSTDDILWLVDIPLLASLGAVTFYVGLGVSGERALFFSGAIAFQFIMGNVLLAIIRTRLALSTPPNGA